jgi:transcriptional regulator with XRE-family HTH domain
VLDYTYDTTSAIRKSYYMMQGSLSDRLRLLRTQRGLTIGEASSRIGIDSHTLSRVERGIQKPHAPTLRKIAEFYGVAVEDLLEESSTPPRAPAPAQESPPVQRVEMDGVPPRRAFGRPQIINEPILISEEELKRLVEGRPARGRAQTAEGEEVEVELAVG